MMCGRGVNMLRSRRSTFLAGGHPFVYRLIQPSLTRTGIVQINARLFKFESRTVQDFIILWIIADGCCRQIRSIERTSTRRVFLE